MEHDPKVLEFYDQPPLFKIQLKNQADKSNHHPVGPTVKLIL